MKNVAASAETHTHTHSPAEARDQGSPSTLGGEGAYPGHDTDSRGVHAAARILCAEVPRPVDSVRRNNGGD